MINNEQDPNITGRLKDISKRSIAAVGIVAAVGGGVTRFVAEQLDDKAPIAEGQTTMVGDNLGDAVSKVPGFEHVDAEKAQDLVAEYQDDVPAQAYDGAFTVPERFHVADDSVLSIEKPEWEVAEMQRQQASNSEADTYSKQYLPGGKGGGDDYENKGGPAKSSDSNPPNPNKGP